MAAKDLTGRTFGSWIVIGASEKSGYVKCRCECGTVRDVYRQSLKNGKSTSCQACANRRMAGQRSQEFLKKRKEQYIGQVINGWKIIDVYKNPSVKGNDLFCTALCPVCGRKSDMRLFQVKKISKCKKCTNNVKLFSDAIHREADVDGSSLVSVKSRLSGKVNQNSTTGHSGVFKDKNRYRAVICFKGHKTYLGTYDTIEKAVAARKAAEELIYAPFLKEHEGWEEELARRLEELKKEKK